MSASIYVNPTWQVQLALIKFHNTAYKMSHTKHRPYGRRGW